MEHIIDIVVEYNADLLVNKFIEKRQFPLTEEILNTEQNLWIWHSKMKNNSEYY